MQLFEKAADYQAFEQVLRDTLDQSPMRICAYAVMPNHWHLLLWPECDGELAAFMQRLTITHVRRWQEHRGYAGLPCLPRSIQVVPSGKRRAFLGCGPIRSSATRCAPISSCERRNGGGQACGNAVILREKGGRCWRRGRSICLRIQRPKTRLEPSRVVLYPFAQHSVRHGDPLEHHGGRYDAPPLASRHRLQILGT